LRIAVRLRRRNTDERLQAVVAVTLQPSKYALIARLLLRILISLFRGNIVAPGAHDLVGQVGMRPIAFGGPARRRQVRGEFDLVLRRGSAFDIQACGGKAGLLTTSALGSPRGRIAM
jgi:hypothetical protein